MRAEAARRGIRVADKPDCNDICFIADGDTRGFLAQRLGTPDGAIVDSVSGEVLGRHQGAYAYTVGQRRGLDLRVAAPDRRPRYVLSITPATNTVTVGPVEALDVTVVHGDRAIWTGTPPDTTTCDVQLRAHGEALPAEVTPTADGGIVARLAVPARGIAAGQAIVAYRADPGGDIVLCAATVTATG